MQNTLNRIAMILVCPFVRVFIRSIKGKENIPKEGGFIIAANHESFIDPLVIPSSFFNLTKKKLYYFAKKEGWWDLLGDKVCKDIAGCIPIEKSKASKKAAIKEAESILKKGDIVSIFPEGRMSIGGKLSKGKTGAIRLSNKDVPILPVGLINTSNFWPRGKKIPNFRRCIQVSIGKPIHFNSKNASKKKLIDMTNQLMKKIAALIGKKYMF